MNCHSARQGQKGGALVRPLIWWGLLLCVICLGGARPVAAAEDPNRKPKADDPAAHAFPALGSAPQRKVSVEWNRFYDTAGLGAILARLHAAFPKLTKLYSIGKSVEGRDLWCLELTSEQGGEARRK